MTTTQAAVTILAMVAAAGCTISLPGKVVTGSGNVLTQEMVVTEFDSVVAGSAFDVEIFRGETCEVTLQADDNVMEHVKADVRNGALHLSVPGSITLRGSTLKADVRMPLLREVDAHGAAHVAISGFETSEPISIDLSGASSFEGRLRAGRIEIDLSGASSITLEGSADHVSLEASGASDVDLEEFTVRTAEVSMSGASGGTICVTESIESADLSGAATLSYMGGANVKVSDTSGASTLRQLAADGPAEAEEGR